MSEQPTPKRTPSDNARENPGDSSGRGSGQSRTTRVLSRGIPLLVLVLVIGGGYFFWRHYDTNPKHEGTTPAPAAMAVRVVRVEKEDVPVHPRFLGRTEGSQVVEIRARVAGYLYERSFEEGTRVEKGQQLFQIDPRPFETDLARARAHLRSAQATLSRADLQVERYTELNARQSATQGELEEWEQQQGVAAADVEMARAEIASAQLNLEYTRIEAPIAGMIGEALKEVGSYVDSGSSGLVAVIQQVDPIDVRFSVTEQEMLRWNNDVESGRLASPSVENIELGITLADGSTYAHRGRINYVDVQIDETTGTSIVRASLPNPDLKLKPGQFVHVDVLGIKRVGVIRVPQNAVIQDATGASVYVVSGENKIDARPVTLGVWSGTTDWIIESGLNPGDRVVTSRLMMLRPGSAVEIIGEAGGDGADAATAQRDADDGSDS